jgi:SsrA-binding protein
MGKKNPKNSTDDGRKMIAVNKKARHQFLILDRFEAGIALQGTEVKSLRDGKVSLGEAYARIDDGEVFLLGAHIDVYKAGSYLNHEPTRRRKLLLHKREINRLVGKLNERGLTLVPLSMYFKRGLAKVELGLARGKKAADKRETIKKRDVSRDIERAMAHRGRR